MTCPVQEVDAPEDLLDHYRDAPDGIRVNMITSLDGCAAFHGVAGPLSNECDQNLLLALRGYADVVLVGAGTVRAERYGPVRLTDTQLADRQTRGGAESVPPIAVVTRSGDLPASLFAESGRRPLLVTTAERNAARPDLRRCCDVLVAGETTVDIGAAVAGLRAQGLRRILCEGGPTLLDELTGSGLVDELCLTVSPTLAAETPSRRPGAPLTAPAPMALAHALRVGDYLYLKYRRAPDPQGMAQ